MTAPPSKELGESEVASELVPGNVEHMHGQVWDLRREAKKIADLEESFRAVRIPGWVGDSSETWEDDFDAECAKWTLYGSVLTTTAKALNTYTHAISSAQAKAREAIALYKRGDHLTATAHAAWEKARDAFLCYQPPSRATTIADAVTVQPPRQTMRPADPGPFDDPGEALRAQAREILETAREALDEAGQEALVRLDGPQEWRDFDLGDLILRGGGDRELSGPTLEWTRWRKEFGTYDRTPNDDDPSPFTISLGEVEGSVYVYGADGEVTEYYGDTKVTADGRIVVGEASASAGASVGPDGLELGADARIEYVAAEGSVRGEYGKFQAEVKAHGAVGADANGNLTLNKNGAHAGVEIFYGAKAGLDGEVSVGGVTVRGGGEVRAGFGGSVEADAGVDDGKVTIKLSAGLTLGVGGKVEGGMEIDFGEVGDTISDAADTMAFWDD